MKHICNVGVICDIRDNTPVGVFCINNENGDIAYYSTDEMLLEVIDILLENKLFLLMDETINQNKMIREEEINNKDKYFIIAFNYALPFPWRILGVTQAEGDVEELAMQSFNSIWGEKNE